MSNRLIIATTAEDIALAATYATNARKKFSLITKDGLRDCADCFHSFVDIITIDTENIKKVMASPLIHDGIVINQVWSKLNSYVGHCEEVINISKDRFSSLITSYLAPKSYSGAKVNSFNDVMYKSKVDSYFANSVENDLYLNRTEGTLFSDNINFASKPMLNSNPQHDELCRTNFTKIRNSFNGERSHIVGIDLNVTQILENHIIEQIIRDLQSETTFYPVLLASKIATTEQLSAIKYLNEKFNNSLLTIKSDEKALISVLNNIDLIITNDNFNISFSDMTDTPTVQITTNIKKVTTYSLYSNYIFDLSKIGTEFSMEVGDVCNHILNGHIIEDIPGLFKVKTGRLGRYPQGISSYDYSLMMMKRLYLNTLHTGDKVQTKNFNIDRDTIKMITNKEKAAILELSRLILSSIRLLKAKVNNKESATQFISNIEAILTFSASDYILSIATKMFQNEMSLLPKTNSKANSIVAEKILFNLKNDLKVLNGILEELSTEVSTERINQPQI